MKISIIILATNSYWVLGLRLIKQMKKYYKGKMDMVFHIFTDIDIYNYLPQDAIQYVKSHTHSDDSWVKSVNTKFSNIVRIKDDLLVDTDYVFFLDADTHIKGDFDEQFMLGDVVGEEHFNNSYEKVKPYERRHKSISYIPFDTPHEQIYYHGAFFGGRTQNVIDLCAKLIDYQAVDNRNNIEPVWNDESYLNNVFHYTKPDKVILFREFQKVISVSDKGGIDNMRHVNHEGNKISNAANAVKLHANKDKMFDLVKGNVVISNIPFSLGN